MREMHFWYQECLMCHQLFMTTFENTHHLQLNEKLSSSIH